MYFMAVQNTNKQNKFREELINFLFLQAICIKRDYYEMNVFRYKKTIFICIGSQHNKTSINWVKGGRMISTQCMQPCIYIKVVE